MHHRLLAVGTTVGGTEERLAAGGTVAGKDEAAIGADLGSGEEFHLASWTDEGEFQFAVRTVFDGFIVLIGLTHGGAAARAEELPAGGAGWVTTVDAGATVGTDQVGSFLWLAFDIVKLGAALKNKAAMGAGLVVGNDVAVAARAAQCPGRAAY